MESFGNVTCLNSQQNDALSAAWQLMSFIEGAVAPKLEVVDTDTTPFLDGLYRSIQEVKKQLDIAVNGAETTMEAHPLASGIPIGVNLMQDAITGLVNQGNMIERLAEDLHCKADRMATDLERANDLHALAVTLENHREALSEVSAIVEGVKRVA